MCVGGDPFRSPRVSQNLGTFKICRRAASCACAFAIDAADRRRLSDGASTCFLDLQIRGKSLLPCPEH